MSKYYSLWKYIQNDGRDTLILSFEEIGKIAGVPIDHSFLNYRKELLDYGYRVDKISLIKQSVIFTKTK